MQDIAASEANLSTLVDKVCVAKLECAAAHEILELCVRRVEAFNPLTMAHSANDQSQTDIAAIQAQIPPEGLAGAKAIHAQAFNDRRALRVEHELHTRQEPGYFANMLRTASSLRWQEREEQFQAALEIAKERELKAAEEVFRMEDLIVGLSKLKTGLKREVKRSSPSESVPQKAEDRTIGSDTPLRLIQHAEASRASVEEKRHAIKLLENDIKLARHSLSILRDIAACERSADLNS